MKKIVYTGSPESFLLLRDKLKGQAILHWGRIARVLKPDGDYLDLYPGETLIVEGNEYKKEKSKSEE